LPAVQTVLTIVRLTLACEGRIIAYMTFRSRDEVDQLAAVVRDAFSQTSEVAADDLDAGTYMTIIKLHGDVTRHLAERGRQLPRVITYTYQMTMRAYADPNRYTDLINENDVVHPAFCPREGKMLAV
jgi:prophage DNA circulation protein